MTKHTAGPWKYNGNKVVTNGQIESDRTFGYGCQDDFICDLDDGEYHNYSNSDEMNANGYLIAAAPDLLAACEIALQFCGEYPEVYDLVADAIARAKGRENE